jgi:hypothetical protein
MLLEFIARYYKFFWIGLCAISLLKILLATIFHGSLEGVNGVLYALFKWYGDDEQEMEDVASRRTMMRFHNIITLMVYGAIAVVLVATLIPMFIGR